jgi:hypothetical protein
MERTGSENLKVYQLAEKLIGANIAEGAGRGSYQDNRRFVILNNVLT